MMYCVMRRPLWTHQSAGGAGASARPSGADRVSLLVQPDAVQVAPLGDLEVALHKLLVPRQVVGVIQEGEGRLLAGQVVQVLEVLGALLLVGRRALVLQ